MFSLWMPKRLILGRDWECSFAFSVKAECLLPRAAVVVRVAITSGHGMGPLIAGKNGSRLAGLSNHREQITNISFEQVKRAWWVCKPTLGNFCHFLVLFWGNFEEYFFSQVSCKFALSKTLFVPLKEGQLTVAWPGHRLWRVGVS